MGPILLPPGQKDYNLPMKTVYTFVPAREHQYPDHPERPGRLEVLEPQLGSFGAERIEPNPATIEQVARVHLPEMIREIEEVCKQGRAIIDHAPTFVTRTSYEDALLAAGGVIGCTRAVLDGNAGNAFAIVRPPGHHAEPDRAMGFCIFNNIAIAAQEALAHGLQRVMVIDFDAHHGNGTQAAFLNDDRAGFISTHQWGIYPGTGWIEDAPHAKGRIVNVPLKAYAGDETLLRVADDIFKPAVEKFQPQMLLVSVGFDAHWNDPITTLGLSTQGYFDVSEKLVRLAQETCNGRVVFVLEGGYDPHNVANGAAAVFSALTGSGLRKEADDVCPYKDPDHESRIAEVRKWHGI
jgi:acetoin utilization deacetylase AcuC-like enzyme